MSTADKMDKVRAMVFWKLDEATYSKAWTLLARGACPDQIAAMIHSETLLETSFHLIPLPYSHEVQA